MHSNTAVAQQVGWVICSHTVGGSVCSSTTVNVEVHLARTPFCPQYPLCVCEWVNEACSKLWVVSLGHTSAQRPLMLFPESAGAILPVLGLQFLVFILPLGPLCSLLSTSAPAVPSAPDIPLFSDAPSSSCCCLLFLVSYHYVLLVGKQVLFCLEPKVPQDLSAVVSTFGGVSHYDGQTASLYVAQMFLYTVPATWLCIWCLGPVAVLPWSECHISMWGMQRCAQDNWLSE